MITAQRAPSQVGARAILPWTRACQHHPPSAPRPPTWWEGGRAMTCPCMANRRRRVLLCSSRCRVPSWTAGCRSVRRDGAGLAAAIGKIGAFFCGRQSCNTGAPRSAKVKRAGHVPSLVGLLARWLLRFQPHDIRVKLNTPRAGQILIRDVHAIEAVSEDAFLKQYMFQVGPRFGLSCPRSCPARSCLPGAFPGCSPL